MELFVFLVAGAMVLGGGVGVVVRSHPVHAALSLILNHANPASNAGGDAAHLGGAIAGFWLIRRPHLLTDFFDILKDSRKPRKPKLRLADEPQATPQDEIDRILAKVSAQGKESLSDRERDILHEATQRLRGRTG